jgi:hypothetical protein
MPNKVTTSIVGLAGSIASVIALAGDEINISEAGSIMIHNASSMRGGNADQMRKAVTDLKKIDDTITAIYIAKTGLPEANIKKLMKGEAIMNASEAMDFGFVDNIVNPIKAVALFEPNNINTMDRNEILNKASAFLGLNKEHEAVKELVDAADELAVAKQQEKEAISNEAELLTAHMVASTDYLADMTLLKDFVASAIAFIEAQPTEEEINARIKAEVETANIALLASLKTKTQVPRATTQPLVEAEKRAEEVDLTGFNNAFEKIKEKSNKLYN